MQPSTNRLKFEISRKSGHQGLSTQVRSKIITRSPEFDHRAAPSHQSKEHHKYRPCQDLFREARHHNAEHAGIAMTWDAGFGEPPDDLVRFLRRDTPRIRIVVLHLLVLFHRFRVLQVPLGGRKQEFVVELLYRTNLICSPLRISTRSGTKSIFPSFSCMVTWMRVPRLPGRKSRRVVHVACGARTSF
jgi:hypothetical protein